MLVSCWEMNLLGVADGFLSPFPVDAAESPGSLGLFLSVSKAALMGRARQAADVTAWRLPPPPTGSSFFGLVDAEVKYLEVAWW